MNWITHSLKNLLITAMVGSMIVIALPTFFFITITHTEQLVNDHGDILQSFAATAATVIAENLGERKREIELLAQTPLYTYAPLDSSEFQNSINRVQASYPHYSWIGIVGLDGVVRAATGGLLLGQNVAHQPWFQHSAERTYIGDVHKAKLLAKLLPSSPDGLPIRLIDFAVQVKDRSGHPRAVLGVHANWTWSSELIRVVMPKTAKADEIEFFIVNRDNKIIFPTPKDSGGAESDAPRLLNNDSFELLTWNPGGPRYLTASAPVKIDTPDLVLGWKVLVRQPEAKVLKHVHELQRAISLVILGSILIFIFWAWILGRWIGRPIHQLTMTAQQLAQGQTVSFNSALPTDEMRNLSKALQKMSDDLIRNQQKLEEKVAQRTKELEKLNNALTELARRDVLTGLPNRLAANEFLGHEFNLLGRRPLPYAVLLMDIDFFKRVNDTYGHAMGDEVLKHVAALLEKSVRESDFIGRVGGEEFLAVLPMTSLTEAVNVAEKIREKIASSPMARVGTLTVSIGVSMANVDDDSADVAVQSADSLLYAAKRKGRNRVEFIPESLNESELPQAQS